MLLGIYTLTVITAAVFAKRVWYLLPITVVTAIILTILSIDMLYGLRTPSGYELSAIDFVSFWIVIWLATLLPALLIYGLKRLIAAAAR